MEKKEAALGSLSHLLHLIVTDHWKFQGEECYAGSPATSRVSKVLFNAKMSEGFCKFLFALYFSKKHEELEMELLKLEQKLLFMEKI